MAVILCPNCGKENPDSLKACQFCQTPLPSASPMRMGDKPTKKTTGELEPVLPDWLRDVRQQARDAAEKDADEAASMPKVQKPGPPDLLAGLASQSAKSDEDDLPDWLTGLTSKQEEKPASSPPARSTSEFFAQFEKAAAQQPEPGPPPASTNETPEPSTASPERDELSEWFAKASGEPSEPFSLETDLSGQEADWGFEGTTPPSFTRESEPSLPEEDLSWLHNLEAEARKTGELSQPKQEDSWTSVFDSPTEAGSSAQDDLSWLDSLGGLSAAEQTGQGPSGTEEDLGWLNAFGETPQAPQPPAVPPAPQSEVSRGDPSDSPAPAEKADDLGWLDELGGASQAAGPAALRQEEPASADDLSWLRDLQDKSGTYTEGLPDSAFDREAGSEEAAGMPHVSPFMPSQTAPLADSAGPELPDWLKSVTGQPALPLGPEALDQIREVSPPASGGDRNVARTLLGAAMLSKEEEPAPPAPETPSLEPPASSREAAPLFNEASSLFSDDLPDWLTSAEPVENPPEQIGIHSESGEALTPAELPSWVQAMRPVEAVVADAAMDVDNLPVEREGPLAGLKGVIPMAAIGSLRRPRPIPLTLQTTEDQQASAAILEQMLFGETTPRPAASAPVVTSQQTLRWIVAGLLVLVLGAVLFSGTQIMPVSPVLPPEARDMTSVVMSIADNAPVLVIMDYQPGLAGEMEAVSGPLLDQLVRLHHPYLTFVATSPSGNALVERLLANTDINQPGGMGYVSGQNYADLGYLPGGEAGVLAFLQSPQAAIPSSPVLNFSEYAAVLLLTDHADSARTWVEQLSIAKQNDPALAGQPLLAAASAQTGPMLLPYFSSKQITGMISGLPAASSYESLNDSRPGMARGYWDAFGVGMMMAVLLIVGGSLWSVFSGVRAGRMKAAEE